MPVIGSSTSSYQAAGQAYSNATSSSSPLVNQAKLGKNAQPITVLNAEPPKQVDLKTEIKESRPYEPTKTQTPKEITSIDALQKTITSDDLESIETINASEPRTSLVTDGMSNKPTTTQVATNSASSQASSLPPSGIYA